MCLPSPRKSETATTAIRAKISAYSTRLWPFGDRKALRNLRIILFILRYPFFSRRNPEQTLQYISSPSGGGCLWGKAPFSPTGKPPTRGVTPTGGSFGERSVFDGDAFRVSSAVTSSRHMRKLARSGRSAETSANHPVVDRGAIERVCLGQSREETPAGDGMPTGGKTRNPATFWFRCRNRATSGTTIEFRGTCRSALALLRIGLAGWRTAGASSRHRYAVSS